MSKANTLLSDSEGLDAILLELVNSADWNADTLDAIAEIVYLTGREFKTEGHS